MKLKIGFSFTAVFSLTGFIIIAALLKTGSLDAFNINVGNKFISILNTSFLNFLKVFTNFGEWYVYVPIALVLILIPKTRFKIGIPVLIILGLSAGINTALKHIFRIARPLNGHIEETGYGFPSGHSMNAAVFLSMICYFSFKLFVQKNFVKIISVIMAVLFVLMIGFSRLYLNVHSISDVIGGYLLGLFVSFSSMFFYQHYWEKYNLKKNAVKEKSAD